MDPLAGLPLEPIALPPPGINQEGDVDFTHDEFLQDFAIVNPKRKHYPERKLEELKVEIIPTKKSLPTQFNDLYLNKFVTSMGHISNTAIDVVYEESLKGKESNPPQPEKARVNYSAKLANAPEYAKKTAHLFLSVSLGINEKFHKLDLSVKTSPEINQAISWLTTNEYIDSKGQTETLLISLRKAKLDAHQEKYREIFIEWLLSSADNRPLIPLANVKDAKECLVALVNHLLSMKVEQLTKRIVEQLGDKLPDTLHKFLKDHVGSLISIEASKAGSIIESLRYDWNSFVDQTVSHLKDFVIGTNESLAAKERSRKNYKEGIESELDRKTDKEMREAYVNKGKPHNITVTSKLDLANAYLIAEKHNRAEGEQNWLSANINKIVDIMFAPDLKTIEENHQNPQETRSPDEQSVDFWNNQIELPEQWKSLVEQSKKLAEEMIDPKVITFFQGIPAWLGGDIKQLIISRLKNYTVKLIIREVLEKIDSYTHPDKIEELLALKILPAVQPVLAKFIVKHEIVEVLKAYDLKKPSEAFGNLSKLLYEYHLQDDNRKNPVPLNNLFQHILDKEIPAVKFDGAAFAKISTALVKDLNDKMKDIPKDMSYKEFMGYLHQVHKTEEDDSPASRMKHSLSNLTTQKELTAAFDHRLSIKESDQVSEPYNKFVADFKVKVRKSLSSSDSKALSDAEISAHVAKFLEDFYHHLQTLKKKHPEFNKNSIEVFFKSYFDSKQTAVDSLVIYSDLLKEVVQMTTLSGFNKTASSLLLGPIYRKVVDAVAKDIRSSPEFLINLLAEELPDALDAPTLFDVIYTASSGPKGPLRDELFKLQQENNIEAIKKHPLTTQRQEFDKAMLKTCHLAHRLIHQKVKGDGAAIEKGVSVLVGSPTELAANITQVYRKLLGSQFRTKDLVYKLLPLAVDTLHGKWKTLTP